MKQHLFRVLVLFVCASATLGLAAQTNGTFHLITCIDRVNTDISRGCEQDFNVTNEFGREAARLSGMSFAQYDIPFGKEALSNFFNNEFQCTSEDVVVFYYSGHGYRYDEDGDEFPWPYLCLCGQNDCKEQASTEFDSPCEYDLEEIYELLVQKGPRMSLTIGNCCNDPLNAKKPASGTLPNEEGSSGDQPLPGAALFSQFRGNILTSASAKDQVATTNTNEGSLYTVQLYVAIMKAMEGEDSVSWTDVLRECQAEVFHSTRYNQAPMFRVRD